MSFGTTALLLIRLDQVGAHWESVVELARRFAVSESEVRQHLEALTADGLARVQRDAHTGEIQAAMSEPSAVSTKASE
ncbi:hypothetical protein [Caldimonas sp. KR1-144]|uniref:hypothetical protein n=1 Tax=Caldimonas sp. KR1-144 TaxID=3400911 RepID=UPI003C08AB6E